MEYKLQMTGADLESRLNEIPQLKTSIEELRGGALTAGKGISIVDGVISVTFEDGDEVVY